MQLEGACIIMKLIEAVWFGRSGLKSNQSNKTIYYLTEFTAMVGNNINSKCLSFPIVL